MDFIQDLFWANLPYKPKNKTAGIFQDTFLNKFKSPVFLYTGTNYINFDRFVGNPKFIQKIKKIKESLEIFLYEPLSYYFKNYDYNLGFYSEFHNRFNNDRTLRSEELDSINEFAQTLSIKITVNLCDLNIPNHFKDLYPCLTLQTRDIFIRQAAAMHTINRYSSDSIKTKFWCANGRYTIHRHIIMCYLSNFKGNYSWFFDAPCNWQEYVGWLEDLPYSYLEKSNINLIKNRYRLDKTVDTIEFDYLAGYEIPEIDFVTHNSLYDHSFKESFCCVINETRFAQPSANFSEKTLKAIAMRKPFVLVAPPGTINYLQKMGFKTFSLWWDETYDQEQNHSNRIRKIFSIINQLNSKSLAELKRMYDSMQEILDYNVEVLQNLKNNHNILNAYAN